ncbi:MAG: DinB family protein [Bacteroidota bacterium]
MSLFPLLMAEVDRRLFVESFARVRTCLGKLSEEQIWQRPNANSNSIGNLVLHLCGNARQWIIAGLLGTPDVRQRQQEFDEQGPLPTAHLLDILNSLEAEMKQGLATVTASDLAKVYQVQTFEENGVAIIVHVVEHFSYHVGQITYQTKALLNIDTGYYAGMTLE